MSVHKDTYNETEELKKQIETLERVNEALMESIKLLEEKVIHCPLTGLYNDEFFQRYIQDILNACLSTKRNGALLFISIDHFGEINLHYGSDAADETLKKYAAYLTNQVPQGTILFRLNGALFACYIPDLAREGALEIAEKIRMATASADIFVCYITVSVGVILLDELFMYEDLNPEALVDFVIDVGKQRLNIAKKRGYNQICAESDLKIVEKTKAVILLADANIFRLEMLADLLESEHFAILKAHSGDEALSLIINHEVDLILADLSLPGMNAIEIKQQINHYSRLVGIPFVLITDKKRIDILKQAYAQGILIVLERPLFLEELLAIVSNFSKTKVV
ncbi:MAG TPA: diguanylate cyclase [Termitinemataceae bacterium]|nr:diguanylate cyclase [Termitinemataceae bacterium]HPQ00638.1 diguanylate cyclase [Termitinemataceae bacterium]